MILKNKSIQCLDCGASFIFSAVEQEYFLYKGETREPVHCPSCRQARKERQSMAASEKSEPRRSESRTFSTNCARCGKNTQVSFEPRQGRPVYCPRCYDAIRTHR